jgi:hypothetical protein
MVSEKSLRGLLDPAVEDVTIRCNAGKCHQSKRPIIPEDSNLHSSELLKSLLLFITQNITVPSVPEGAAVSHDV